MVSILVVSHGDFCTGIIHSMEMLVGEAEQVRGLPLLPSDSVESYRDKILETVKELDRGDGVLVLVDLPGGSPYNATAGNLGRANFECLTGLNLSMLLTAVEEREDRSLAELPELCAKAAKEGIIDIRKLITRGHGEKHGRN